jgi:hypothetical protein
VETDTQIVRLHPAFEAFLTDDRRCIDKGFFIDVAVNHEPLAGICLHVMNNLLRHNICEIESASLVNSELPRRRQRIAQFVPECLQYASRNWLNHIVSTNHDADGVIGLLRQFLFVHFLHWVELSSLLGEFDAVLPSLNRLRAWLEVCSPYSRTSDSD